MSVRDQMARAEAAMTMLDAKWFSASTSNDWGGGGNFWKTPTICMAILSYMAQSGSQAYIQTIENARLVGQGYIGNCGYHDDETCWGRMFIQAYAYLSSISGLQRYAPPYMSNATAIYNDVLGGWANAFGGGVWWRRDPKSHPGNTQAANATLGLMEISLGLYHATQQTPYLATAQKCWVWLKQANLIVGGLVIGELDASGLPDPNDGPVIALQGNPLGPLWSLYAATGDTSCLDVGEAIVTATLRQMTWPTAQVWSPSTAILKGRADADWNASGDDFHQAYSGETPFKGIFAGLLGPFAANLGAMSDTTRQAAVQVMVQALIGNSDALVANFPGGAYGMDWHTFQPNYQPNADNGISAPLQYGALQVFLAAALISPLA